MPNYTERQPVEFRCVGSRTGKEPGCVGYEPHTLYGRYRCDFDFNGNCVNKQLTAVTEGNMGEWISVEDRLPPSSGYYMAYLQAGDVRILGYGIEDGWRSTLSAVREISHWMPIPEPPVVKIDCRVKGEVFFCGLSKPSETVNCSRAKIVTDSGTGRETCAMRDVIYGKILCRDWEGLYD